MSNSVCMMPPGSGLHSTIKVNGRTYTCAVGSAITVPDFDAAVMAANGWISLVGFVGPTTSRPSTPNPDQLYNDTTLTYAVVYDGKTWRNPQTGASV